jgi:hypothetical protein
MTLRLLLLVFSLGMLVSCNRYKAYQSHYSFKSQDGRPDYSQLDYWAAHPAKQDPSDSIPLALAGNVIDSTVDVFFLHPTTLTKTKNKQANAVIDDPYINAKTDYSTILYQASVFNSECRVFAPRYRQAHISNFFSTDSAKALQSFRIAYEDIKAAFEYYVQHFNNGRPIIIAAHSQGSKLAAWLLKDYFENKPLYNKLVVAYLTGWPIRKDYFTWLKPCEDSLQTGCFCSWRTLRKGYIPSYLRDEKEEVHATNPLLWVTNETYAPKQLNRGSVLTKFNKVYTHVTDAQLNNGLLFVKKPKFPWGFLYFTKNYHIGDINLFYINIRENVRRRIGMFWKR